MHTCFHFLTGAMGLLPTFASPIFPLYVQLESVIRLPSLLRCGGQPTQKTTAGRKKHILNSHYLVPLICSYMRWKCSCQHVIRCTLAFISWQELWGYFLLLHRQYFPCTYSWSLPYDCRLLGCGGRPTQKTTAGKTKNTYTKQSLFSSFN